MERSSNFHLVHCSQEKWKLCEPRIMLEIMFRFWDLILTVTMFEFANLRSEGFTIGFIVLLNQSAGWLIIRTSIRVRSA